ncbi:MAG TPA: type IVB secretion system protein IcmH/DotU [Blastocatellia bacterium]|nr:type IVB secretion system protein IcmH/DotU [Blastocatellia bacterium]
MQSAIAERPAASPRSGSDDDLVSLASPVIQMVTQIRAGLVTPSNELRPTLDALLKQMEQRAQAARYKEADINSAKFALAAFIDETVLTAQFPLREQWEKYPLQLEYFGEHLAGVKFFDRLDALLKDPNTNQDLVELCYLCLVLGYKGKYMIFPNQLQGVIDNVADYLRRSGRLRTGSLSPHWKVQDQPPPPQDAGLPRWVKVGGALALGLIVLVYMILLFWIRSDLNAVKEQLLR